MSPGICKKCNRPVMWVKDRDGRWMRPLEMLEMVLSPDQALLLNSSPLYRLQDGVLAQVRVSTLLLQHQCPPTVDEMDEAYATADIEDVEPEPTIEATRTPEEIEADYFRDVVLPMQKREQEAAQAREARAIAEARELARQHIEKERAKEQVSRSIDQRIAQAIRRHGEAIKAYCPRCKASEGMVCNNASANYADGKRMDDPRRYNRAPHQERIDYAIGSGVMQPSEEQVRDYVVCPQAYLRLLAPQPADDQKLRHWLGAHADIWRPENWATTSLLEEHSKVLD